MRHIAVSVAALVLTAAASAAPAPKPKVNPFKDPVVITTYPNIELERPMFNADGTKLLGDKRSASLAGQQSTETPHVYVVDFDPKTGIPSPKRTCLTCGEKGPNGFAKWSPDGKWILFGSQRINNPTHGVAGGGHPGDDIWIMRADGSNQTQLTFGTTESADFHANISWDGKKIAWTQHKCVWDCKWVNMIADFVPGPKPKLANVRPLSPEDGAFHEVQDFTFDNKYVMATRTMPGLMNGEAVLIDVKTGKIARRLTNNPYWDEQFHEFPGQNAFVKMSARDNPGKFAPQKRKAFEEKKSEEMDYKDIFKPPVYINFNDPEGLKTDLYVIDGEKGDSATGDRAIRRLTYLGDRGQVIPEFGISPDGCHIAFGGNRPLGDGKAQFLGLQIVSFQVEGCPKLAGNTPNTPVARTAVAKPAAPPAPIANATSPDGMWQANDGLSRINVAPCGAGPTRCATIVWLMAQSTPGAKPVLDIRNYNTALRTRPLMGLKVGELTLKDGKWVGKMYQPKFGVDIDAQFSKKPDGTLSIYGCYGSFCRTVIWTPVR
jgi:uncharacterized protein (DUF2147 family)